MRSLRPFAGQKTSTSAIVRVMAKALCVGEATVPSVGWVMVSSGVVMQGGTKTDERGVQYRKRNSPLRIEFLLVSSTSINDVVTIEEDGGLAIPTAWVRQEIGYNSGSNPPTQSTNNQQKRNNCKEMGMALHQHTILVSE